MLKFEEIISKFQIEGEITDVKPLGHGTVNHTYEIVCGGEHYVLQEMNHIVFKYPTEVMNNLFLVTEYLRDAIEREGRDPELEALTFIRTKAGNQLLQTEEGSYFRLYRMICCGEEDAETRRHRRKLMRQQRQSVSFIAVCVILTAASLVLLCQNCTICEMP